MFVELSPEAAGEVGEEGETAETAPAASVSFMVEIGRILDDLPLEGDVFRNRAFDLLAIADRDGHVVHRSSGRSADRRTGLRLESLDALKIAGGGGEDSDERTVFADLQKTSQVLDATLVGETYRLYCQPLHFPSDGAPDKVSREEAGTNTWVLCGLVAARGSQAKARLVSPWLVLVLGLFLLFGLVTWPLAKLVLLRPRERFQFTDAYLLMVSTFATLMLVTSMVVDGDGYHSLRGVFKDALENLAKEVEENLGKELVALHDQLAAYDSVLCEDRRNLFTGLSTDDHLLGRRNCNPASPGDSRVCFPVPSYDFFSSVFWMNDEGLQFVKGTARDQNTPAVNLYRRKNPRQYFVRIKERTPLSYGQRRFFVEPFRSIHHRRASQRLVDPLLPHRPPAPRAGSRHRPRVRRSGADRRGGDLRGADLGQRGDPAAGFRFRRRRWR